MADLLDKGSAWLEGQRKKHATREVTYRRGVESVVVKATIGRTLLEQDDGAGVIVRLQVRDYLIDTADLVLASEPTLPAKGDRIEEIDAGQKHTYEVLPLGGEQHWRYSDPYRRTLRIHTKLIATEAA
ncbi:MAG: hypothetical protein J5I93_09280 [Pirellulaceae bacterium]|nr:hypothetical protein [Pirellulaceae bacterium]